jgi:hypothetical protein
MIPKRERLHQPNLGDIIKGYIVLDMISIKVYMILARTKIALWEARMSSLKRWRRVGQGQFHKWEQAGEEFEGTWRGAHDGRFGPLGTLETAEGLITFPLPTALLDRLRMVREGAEVLIQYTGMQTSKAGRPFKGFEVFVAGDRALREAPETIGSQRPAESPVAGGHGQEG